MKYVAQYAALAMALLSGTAFLSDFSRLLRTYDFTHQRFASLLLSASDTLLVGITCLASAKIYQLMVRSKSDAISKTQTEIEVAHVGFLVAWSCLLFMVHKMNFPGHGASSWPLVAFVLATAFAIWAGFVMRKTLFKKSADAFAGSEGEALRHWRGAHFIGFTHAMSIAVFGAVLKFLGSTWYVAGLFFGLSLGLLLLWRPRHMAISDAQPA
jgi:hypothetical protein